jgi:uncharacterized protein (TIGR03067 family)
MRIGITLLALFTATAFAPAPFPRTKRGDDQTFNLARFQGEWRSLGLKGYDSAGGTYDINWSVTSVKVVGEQWTFMCGTAQNAQYVLIIDGSRRPAAIDFYSGTARTKEAKPYMLGLIKRQGNRVTILYYATTADKRPASFDRPPSGWWLLTLEKMG